MYGLSLDTCEVNRVIESANHAVITVGRYFSNTGVNFSSYIPLGQRVLDVVQGGVNENARIIPCT